MSLTMGQLFKKFEQFEQKPVVLYLETLNTLISM